MNFLEDLFKKENLIPRILSLLAACGLWVYIMTDHNPIMERNYDVPLQYRNLAGQMVVFNAPATVTVRVRAPRTSLNDEAAKYVSAGINLRDVTEGEKLLPVVVSFANGEVVSVNPHDVAVYVDTISEKTVPVETRVVGSTDDDLTIENKSITPPQVVIEGATHTINTINKVIAPVDISEQRKDFTTESTLIVVDTEGRNISNIMITPERVMVDAAIVRKMIVVDLPVKVNTTGTLPEGLSIKKMEVLPQTVKVTAPPSVLKNVKEIFTKPIVVSDLKEDATIATELFLPDKVLSDTKNVEVKFSLERK